MHAAFFRTIVRMCTLHILTIVRKNAACTSEKFCYAPLEANCDMKKEVPKSSKKNTNKIHTQNWIIWTSSRCQQAPQEAVFDNAPRNGKHECFLEVCWVRSHAYNIEQNQAAVKMLRNKASSMRYADTYTRPVFTKQRGRIRAQLLSRWCEPSNWSCKTQKKIWGGLQPRYIGSLPAVSNLLENFSSLVIKGALHCLATKK